MAIGRRMENVQRIQTALPLLLQVGAVLRILGACRRANDNRAVRSEED